MSSGARWERLLRAAVEAARRANASADAEDAAQEALLRFLEAERRGEDLDDSAAWVASQARFRASDARRSEVRRKERESEYAAASSDGGSSREPSLALEEGARKVPPPLRPVLQAVIEGKTVREIAFEQGLSVSAAQRRVHALRRFFSHVASLRKVTSGLS